MFDLLYGSHQFFKDLGGVPVVNVIKLKKLVDNIANASQHQWVGLTVVYDGNDVPNWVIRLVGKYFKSLFLGCIQQTSHQVYLRCKYLHTESPIVFSLVDLTA